MFLFFLRGTPKIVAFYPPCIYKLLLKNPSILYSLVLSCLYKLCSTILLIVPRRYFVYLYVPYGPAP